MPRRTTLIQRVIFQIQKQISSSATVTESHFFVDNATGGKREVDVVVLASVGDHQVFISIECKETSRAATVEWVEQMIMKHLSLPTSKLVLVSASGFTTMAKKKALLHATELVSLGNEAIFNWAETLGMQKQKKYEICSFRFLGCGLVFLARDDTAFFMPSDEILYDSRGAQLSTLRTFLHKTIAASSEFMSFVLTNMKSQSPIDFEFQFFTSWPIFAFRHPGALEQIKLFVVQTEVVVLQPALDLKALQYKDFQIAYHAGKSGAGDFVMTLVAHPDSAVSGSLVLDKNGDGTVETQNIKFFPNNPDVSWISLPHNASEVDGAA